MASKSIFTDEFGNVSVKVNVKDTSVDTISVSVGNWDFGNLDFQSAKKSVPENTNYLIGIDTDQFKDMHLETAKERIRSLNNGDKITISVFENSIDSGYFNERARCNNIRLLIDAETKIVYEASLF